jgi:hypothetical protein
LKFGRADNGVVEINGQSRPLGNFSVSLAPGAQQVAFTIRRQTAGRPVTVPLIVVGDWGEWRTFVGDGGSGS